MAQQPGGLYRPRLREVTHERLDGEVIAVQLSSGSYFSMVGPAADVWWLISQGVPRDEWSMLLRAVFPDSEIDERSLDDFLAACREARLADESDEPSLSPPEPPPADYARNSWSAPRLEEFSDLRDLILVDPVHDVTDKGWPHTDAEDA